MSALPGMRRVYLISIAFQGEYEVGFANGLLRNGVPVTVIGSNRTLVDRLDRDVEFLNLRGDQSPQRSRFAKFLNLLGYFGALRRTAARDRSAIFHTNGLFALRQGIGILGEALWCRLVFREWWLTVHNLLPHESETWLNKFVFGMAYKLPNRLFVHTEATATALCSTFRVSRDRVQVVEHGIDRFVAPDAEGKERIRKWFDLPEFRTLILQFGNISRYKGVDLLVDAVERAALPGDTFVLIVGRTSSDRYREELIGKLGSMRNAQQIAWRDEYISDDSIPHLLAAADCMVLPYRKIDQSGVMFAAKSAGLPVIASDVGSFRGYVEAGRDVLIPAGNVDALAGALSEVARRGPLVEREKFSESARKKYAWEVTLRPYADFVRQF